MHTKTSITCLAAIAGALCFLVQSGHAQDPYRQFIPDTPPRSPAEQQQMFHLPPGFEIQLVAAEPDIRKPINMAFDAKGRLWVTQSVEYPFPAPPDPGAPGPRDCVKVLEDADGDGRAEKVTTFVDGLNIPIGVIPVSRGCIVYSIPNILRCLDTDGHDRADTRDVLYGTFGYNDTHGMASSFTWGFDGWLYACHGFFNTSEVKGSDGVPIKMQSGNTFRMRPDGSHVEQFTHGQVNPFGLAFDPLGNLYSADCHSRPIYMLLRGAYYPSFGKPHDGLGYGPETCRHEHGSTAIAGIVYYAADHFPPEYRDTIFIGNPVTSRINHDRLERQGSTFNAVEQPDFLRCDDPWFRPVDIKLGLDGALYVADFYNRVIGHYEVPLTHPARDRERGRIWRIVYKGPGGDGQPRRPRADWSTASVVELFNDLAHPNLAVRMLATNQLVERIGQPAAPRLDALLILNQSDNAYHRMHAIWVLERLGALGDVPLRQAMEDSDPGVRTHAMKILAERRELTLAQRELAVSGLRDPDAFVQRAAAEALGRHPHEENLLPLLELRRQVPSQDTHLLHVVRMALRDQVMEPEILANVANGRFDELAERNLADVYPGVHLPAAASKLLRHLQMYPEDRDTTVRYVRHVARYLAEDQLDSLYTFTRNAKAAVDTEQLRHELALLRAMREGVQERGGKLSEEVTGKLHEWAVTVARSLVEMKQPASVDDAIELARTMKLEAIENSLVDIAAGNTPFHDQRPSAITALAAINPGSHLALFSDILGRASEPLPLRQHVAIVLGNFNQAPAQDQLVERLRHAPEQLGVYIAAALAASGLGAERLLSEVAAGKAPPRLLQHPLVNGKLEAAKLPNLKERLAKLTEGLPPADVRLQQIIDQRRSGFASAKPDPQQGAKIYQRHCANCHALGGSGAKVGPQLDGISARGLDRILEDVLDPNRNVDQAFRSSVIALKNGQVLTGLVLSDEAERLVLADSEGKQMIVPKDDIDERTVSKLSPMPANVADLVPEQDFYHLLSYLLTQGRMENE